MMIVVMLVIKENVTRSIMMLQISLMAQNQKICTNLSCAMVSQSKELSILMMMTLMMIITGAIIQKNSMNQKISLLKKQPNSMKILKLTFMTQLYLNPPQKQLSTGCKIQTHHQWTLASFTISMKVLIITTDAFMTRVTLPSLKVVIYMTIKLHFLEVIMMIILLTNQVHRIMRENTVKKSTMFGQNQFLIQFTIDMLEL